MVSRSDRLKRLVKLQDQIKMMHEMRHASHLSQATAAGQEVNELLESLNTASPLPGLFADIYNRRIGAAMTRQAQATAHADVEAGHVATATARSNVVERAYRDAARLEERTQEEKQVLENIERGLSDRK